MRDLISIARSGNNKAKERTMLLLNTFDKFCKKLNKDRFLKLYMLTLYRQSYDRAKTCSIIVKKEFDLDINSEEAKQFNIWINAYFNKLNVRKKIPIETKQELYYLQNKKCNICNLAFNNFSTSLPCDHIIAWSLVGDNLINNLELLCKACNEKKGAKTDYIFKNIN